MKLYVFLGTGFYHVPRGQDAVSIAVDHATDVIVFQ